MRLIVNQHTYIDWEVKIMVSRTVEKLGDSWWAKEHAIEVEQLHDTEKQLTLLELSACALGIVLYLVTCLAIGHLLAVKVYG
jgi:hypothetical protein